MLVIRRRHYQSLSLSLTDDSEPSSDTSSWFISWNVLPSSICVEKVVKIEILQSYHRCLTNQLYFAYYCTLLSQKTSLWAQQVSSPILRTILFSNSCQRTMLVLWACTALQACTESACCKSWRQLLVHIFSTARYLQSYSFYFSPYQTVFDGYLWRNGRLSSDCNDISK